MISIKINNNPVNPNNNIPKLQRPERTSSQVPIVIS